MPIQKWYYTIEIEFLRPILAAQSTRQIAEEFIAKRAGYELSDEEKMTLPEVLEANTSVFHYLDGEPVLKDRQIRGFLRAAANALNGKLEVKPGAKPKKYITALKDKATKWLAVSPEWLKPVVPGVDKPSLAIDYYDRVVRFDHWGKQVTAVKRSEMLPAGTKLTFHILSLDNKYLHRETIEALLEYGYEVSGLGEDRGDYFGKFRVVSITEDNGDDS